MGLRGDLQEQGYSAVAFEMSEADRAAYTAIAKTVIELAQVDAAIHQALTFSLLPGYTGRVDPTLYTVSGPMNSKDKKTWVHLGYQSRNQANLRMPERNQPRELRDLWEPLALALRATELAGRCALAELGRDALSEAVFHPDVLRRNILLRTVIYHQARLLPVGTEAVAGHADQGLASLHWFETHGNWFQAVPYPVELISDDDTEETKEKITAMRSGLDIIVNNHDSEAAFFLGVGAQHLPDEFKAAIMELPVCYHAGIRPELLEETVSPYAEDGEDRVSSISFFHPNLDIMSSGQYQIASISECRPLFK